MACTGTIDKHTVLAIETLPVRVHCEAYGAGAVAVPNRMLYGDGNSKPVSSDEMLLASIEPI